MSRNVPLHELSREELTAVLRSRNAKQRLYDFRNDIAQSCMRLQATNLDLVRAQHLEGANLSNINFRDTRMPHRLNGCRFTRSFCTRTDFSGCDLVGTTWALARLQGANFTKANLYQANLRYASVAGADFTGALMAEAQFSGVPLAQWAQTIGLEHAIGVPWALHAAIEGYRARRAQE